MEKFYTLFIANQELYTSPLVYQFAKKHNYTLLIGEPQVIIFELNTYLTSARYSDICLVYNTNMLDMTSATLSEEQGHFRTKTIITMHIIPREFGSTSIGVTTPVLAETYSLKIFHPWFVRN